MKIILLTILLHVAALFPSRELICLPKETDNFLCSFLKPRASLDLSQTCIFTSSDKPLIRTVPPVSIDFKERIKVANHLFKNAEVHAYAVSSLKSIELINEMITLEIKQYNIGCDCFKKVILERINMIFKNIIHRSNFPVVLDFPQLDSLSAFLDFIGEPFERLRNELNSNEIDKQNAKNALLSEYHYKKSELLKNEQEELHQSPIFQRYLEKLRSAFSKNPRGSIYFAYAWPTDERCSKEYWVHPFLRNLQEELTSGGFPIVLLDIVSNRYAPSMNKYISYTETSDYVLLFGTNSLLDKCKIGVSLISVELVYISRKRKKDLEKNLCRVFPILLTGSPESSLPPEFERFSTIRDWCCDGYLENFQKLFIGLFAQSSERYLPIMKLLWEEVFQASTLNEQRQLDLAWYSAKRKSLENFRIIKDLEGLRSVPTFRQSLSVRSSA